MEFYFFFTHAITIRSVFTNSVCDKKVISPSKAIRECYKRMRIISAKHKFLLNFYYKLLRIDEGYQ